MELVQSIKDNYTLLGDIIKLVEETFQIYSVDDTFYTELENTIKSLLMAQ